MASPTVDVKTTTQAAIQTTTTEQSNEIGYDSNTGKERRSGALQEFCDSTTFHGLRNVSQANSVQRRLIWIIIVVISSGAVVYQCQNFVRLYFSWPVNTKTTLKEEEGNVVFPAVTICNQNAFRLVAAADNDMYEWLADMFSQTNVSTFNYTAWGVGNVSMMDVYLKNKHRKEDMIVRWNGKKCSHEHFNLTLTDAGVCYTFITDSFVKSTGVQSGLQLVVNIEQYEYMKGPHDAVGLKVLLHERGDIPLMQDFADAVPAGMNTFIAVDIAREINLPSPHGDCVKDKQLHYFDRYSQNACFRECITNTVVNKCGCRDIYMPQSSKESINVSASCDCPKACYVMHYRVSASYASANQNTDSRVTLSDKLLRRLGENMNRSIDTREYVVAEKRQANIDEAVRAGGNVSVLIDQRVDGLMEMYVDDVLGKSYNFIMEAGFQKMEDILRYRFIAAWDNIDFYEWMYGSYELSQIMAPSLGKIHQESWRAVIRLSLRKQLLASKRTLHNLHRVHSAYSNGVPLSRYNATSCDWRNFVELNIYMRDLRIEEREQQKAYLLIDLLSDIGGTLGLLIGASVITLFEALDMLAINMTTRRRNGNGTRSTTTGGGDSA
ncbi:hypothetical protein NP493_919g01054 [Ridgeia piscesae]|uniref:Uncharacterized protein n=1 Tax=Ridgeia piscesae TaxID=27915 RepID=A0AAD9KJW2_RIDPI|nr:hypothetical protein NP493_919g01054 [Ridgeia piscesae]